MSRQFQGSLGPFLELESSRPPASQNPHLNDWTGSNGKVHATAPDYSRVTWADWRRIWIDIAKPYAIVGIVWAAVYVLLGWWL
jgi:hypothetical protein